MRPESLGKPSFDDSEEPPSDAGPGIEGSAKSLPLPGRTIRPTEAEPLIRAERSNAVSCVRSSRWVTFDPEGPKAIPQNRVPFAKERSQFSVADIHADDKRFPKETKAMRPLLRWNPNLRGRNRLLLGPAPSNG